MIHAGASAPLDRWKSVKKMSRKIDLDLEIQDSIFFISMCSTHYQCDIKSVTGTIFIVQCLKHSLEHSFDTFFLF